MSPVAPAPGLDAVARAQRLAEDVLAPAALATDAADTVPVELLDALAGGGLYGLAGPASEGGLDVDFETVCQIVEALASGCLTTTFVWAQHLGAVRAVTASENESIRSWLPRLCSGELRAGLALGGAAPGRPQLLAHEVDAGWAFRGTAPFVSGWGRIDVMHAAARTADGRLVWALVDARPSDSLSVERLQLVALNATATVRADFHHHVVPADRVTSVVPYGEGQASPELLRFHASFALGVASRCGRLLGPTYLDDELAQLRSELDRLDPASIEASRALAGELAVRTAAALAVAAGSRSLLTSDWAQLLVREALFTLVYALRPGSREALLGRLGA